MLLDNKVDLIVSEGTDAEDSGESSARFRETLWHSVLTGVQDILGASVLPSSSGCLLREALLATESDVACVLAETAHSGSAGFSLVSVCQTAAESARSPLLPCVWTAVYSNSVALAELVPGIAVVSAGSESVLRSTPLAGMASVAVAPMKLDGLPAGLIAVGRRSAGRSWSENDSECIEEVATGLGDVVMNWRTGQGGQRCGTAPTGCGVILMIDPGGNPVLSVNHAFLDMYGFESLHEIYQRDFNLWPNHVQSVAAITAVAQNGGWSGIVTAQRRNMSTFNAYCSGRSIFQEGYAPYIVWVCQDADRWCREQHRAVEQKLANAGWLCPELTPCRGEEDRVPVEGNGNLLQKEFSQFVHALFKGEAWVSGGLPGVRVCDLVPRLSNREFEVARLVASGLSSKEIAERLFVSLNTVKTHRSRVLSKLQVRNAAELSRVLSQYLAGIDPGGNGSD